MYQNTAQTPGNEDEGGGSGGVSSEPFSASTFLQRRLVTVSGRIAEVRKDLEQLQSEVEGMAEASARGHGAFSGSAELLTPEEDHARRAEGSQERPPSHAANAVTLSAVAFAIFLFIGFGTYLGEQIEAFNLVVGVVGLAAALKLVVGHMKG